MYGFGVALATRGNSPFGGSARPLTPLNPWPPAITGLNTRTVSCSRRIAKTVSHPGPWSGKGTAAARRIWRPC